MNFFQTFTDDAALWGTNSDILHLALQLFIVDQDPHFHFGFCRQLLQDHWMDFSEILTHDAARCGPWSIILG